MGVPKVIDTGQKGGGEGGRLLSSLTAARSWYVTLIGLPRLQEVDRVPLCRPIGNDCGTRVQYCDLTATS